ncbi:MAG: heme NO-binding domain-containing protein [Archangium sp.]
MKATISGCLLEMLDARFGSETSASVVRHAGLAQESTMLRMPIIDIPDSHFSKLFVATLSVTGLNAEQACDAFGEHWCCVYAPKMYAPYLDRFKSAREMIVGLDALHVQITRAVPNARPPRFNLSWRDEKTLDVEYLSERRLIDVYVGLARGVGTYFKEPLTVTKLSETHVQIVFGA